MTDIFDKCVRFKKDSRIVKEEDRAAAEGVMYRLSPMMNAGPRISDNGREVIQFSTNDYLGLSDHPRIRKAATDVIERAGIGSPMGARPLTGDIELHRQLQEKVAAFKRTEASLIFSSGAHTMMGAIAALSSPRDLVIMDRYAHASLVCGARIAGADTKFFKHNDLEDLESVLLEAPPEQAKMVVVDGIYSMQGDMARLPEICALCEKYGARIVVDDAHGTGVCGENGRGAAEYFGVEDRIDLHLGTFSKAVGTIGGFAAADETVIYYLKFKAPTILFTKAMPACIAAATIESLDLVADGNDRRTRLWDNTASLQKRLRQAGFDIGGTQSPITPIQGNKSGAVYLGKALYDQYNIWASAVLYPAVPVGTSILRVTVTANHTERELDALVGAMEELKKINPGALV